MSTKGQPWQCRSFPIPPPPPAPPPRALAPLRFTSLRFLPMSGNVPFLQPRPPPRPAHTPDRPRTNRDPSGTQTGRGLDGVFYHVPAPSPPQPQPRQHLPDNPVPHEKFSSTNRAQHPLPFLPLRGITKRTHAPSVSLGVLFGRANLRNEPIPSCPPSCLGAIVVAVLQRARHDQTNPPLPAARWLIPFSPLKYPTDQPHRKGCPA